MMVADPPPTRQAELPAPLDRDRFRLLRRGVYDDDTIHVYINDQHDFAFLDPLPATDYRQYTPRAARLGLTAYKKQRHVLQDRCDKIDNYLKRADSFLEIGAADGGFLRLIGERLPHQSRYAVEPDEATRAARDAAGLTHFPTTAAAVSVGCRVQCIGMFHVFEHLIDPGPILADIQELLEPGGRLLIEVPSLSDPLLSVFACRPYTDFYFQRQHPFVYSAPSLGRVLHAAGYTIVETLAYQRYGLENHLQWLNIGEPGGNTAYRELFGDIDSDYRATLEATGDTDTVIIIAAAQ